MSQEDFSPRLLNPLTVTRLWSSGRGQQVRSLWLPPREKRKNQLSMTSTRCIITIWSKATSGTAKWLGKGSYLESYRYVWYRSVRFEILLKTAIRVTPASGDKNFSSQDQAKLTAADMEAVPRRLRKRKWSSWQKLRPQRIATFQRGIEM